MEERKNILCVYNTQNKALLELHPASVYHGHKVMVANSLTAAFSLLDSNYFTFDTILCDLFLPRISSVVAKATEQNGRRVHEHPKACAVSGFAFLIPKTLSLIGFGVRIPREQTFIACNDSWTITGTRDWSKLLNKLLFQMEEHVSPTFYSSSKEHPAHFEP